MSVLRRVHTNNFTVIHNALLCDRDLSAEAVGIICYLISKPHNWTLRPGELADRFNSGADRIQRILKELIGAGYIRKTRERDPVTQAWRAVEYIILDTRDEPLPENTEVAQPTPEEPQLEIPVVENLPLQRTEDTKTDSKKAPKARKPKAKAGEYTDDFLQSIWQPYPRKTGTSKSNAFKKWLALSDADQAAVRAALGPFTISKRGTEEQFIPHLEFFISRRIFETVNIDAQPGAPGSAPLPSDRPTWENLSRIYASTNNWSRQWGPEPGRPGCAMPPDLQIKFTQNVNSQLTSH